MSYKQGTFKPFHSPWSVEILYDLTIITQCRKKTVKGIIPQNIGICLYSEHTNWRFNHNAPSIVLMAPLLKDSPPPKI